jgi:hypothetical protein
MLGIWASMVFCCPVRNFSLPNRMGSKHTGLASKPKGMEGIIQGDTLLKRDG